MNIKYNGLLTYYQVRCLLLVGKVVSGWLLKGTDEYLGVSNVNTSVT